MKSYFIVTLIMLGTFLLRLALIPAVGEAAPFIFFFGAIAIISTRFGKGPVILSVITGSVMGGYLVYRGGESPINSAFSSLFFLFVSGAFAYVLRKSTLKLKKQNEELWLAHEQLELSLEVSGVGLWDRNVIIDEGTWSKSYRRLLGYDDDDPLPSGEELLGFVHPDDRDRVHSSFLDAIQNKHDTAVDFRMRDKAGNVRWYTSRGRAIYDKDGSPIRVIGANISIDDKMKRQEALEEEVQKRTVELKSAQAALIQSSKLAALGEMSGGVAHEINSPLSFLRLKTEQITRKIKLHFSGQRFVTESQLEEDLNKMIQTIDRISSIIQGLRYFSKEGLEGDLQKTNIREIINQVMQFIQAKFNNVGIDIRIKISFDGPLYCRKAQVEQVLMSLLQNSYDAISKEKEKWIAIEVEKAGRHVEVKVINSGPKINADIVDKMWQPFFTTKDVGSGAGLGLSIAKGIIESHHGTLEFDERAANTTFVMNLPIYDFD